GSPRMAEPQNWGRMAPVLVIFDDCHFGAQMPCAGPSNPSGRASQPLHALTRPCRSVCGPSVAGSVRQRVSGMPLLPRCRISVLGREAALPHLLGVFAGGCADLVAGAVVAHGEF